MVLLWAWLCGSVENVFVVNTVVVVVVCVEEFKCGEDGDGVVTVDVVRGDSGGW